VAVDCSDELLGVTGVANARVRRELRVTVPLSFPEGSWVGVRSALSAYEGPPPATWMILMLPDRR